MLRDQHKRYKQKVGPADFNSGLEVHFLVLLLLFSFTALTLSPNSYRNSDELPMSAFGGALVAWRRSNPDASLNHCAWG